MLNYRILDSSALANLARWDPEALQTIAHRERSGEGFATSLTLLNEVFSPLADQPFRNDVIASVRFLLKIWPVGVLPDVGDGLRQEFEGVRGFDQTRLLSGDTLHQIYERLREASLGQFPVQLRKHRDAERALARSQIGSFEQTIDRITKGRKIVKRTFPEFLAQPGEEEAARNLFMHISRQNRWQLTEECVDLVTRSMRQSPLETPYWAGVFRATMFHNWHSRMHDRTAGAPDLKHMLFSLSCRSVWTSDIQMLRRGRVIYPEVEWINTEEAAKAVGIT